MFAHVPPYSLLTEPMIVLASYCPTIIICYKSNDLSNEYKKWFPPSSQVCVTNAWLFKNVLLYEHLLVS